ncbi:MAG: DNA repair protein RecO [Acidobacteriia bacterium]|nr:DNA repair protein RecO [Terriglobia bacterium]MYG02408.1 DNA repair protein RecO [Terriglobia bacterium]MYK09941.1 DNA repair protein RecO [Terriglobia bacterium]
MPSRESEALILRNYPYRDADLIVSFFTRERGKLRGVASGVRRPKNNKFGIGLERLALSHVYYLQKENRDLVTVQRAELAGPSNLWKATYPTSIVLDVIAEATDLLLPEQEPNDAHFRLLRLVVEEFRRGIAEGDSSDSVQPWAHRALVYYLLWSARLGGWLPPLGQCIESNQAFAEDEPAYFGADREGLFRAEFKDSNSWALPYEARALAAAMLKQRLDKLDVSLWQEPSGFALQRFLLQRTQAQIEVQLRGVQALRELWRDAPAGQA